MSYLSSEYVNNVQRSRVRDETHAKFGRFYDELCGGVDALIFISYAFDLPASLPTSPEEKVGSYTQHCLYTSIFAFLASLDLIEHGFYSQSIVVNRGLMETLVTVICLADSPADIDRLPRASIKVQNPLRFRERFERTIPGYYDTHYRLSSEFVHPGHASHILKVIRRADGTSAPETGIVFNEQSMSMCMNELSILLAGFLRVFVEKFRGQLNFRLPIHEGLVREARVALAKIIDSHVQFKGENEWHRLTRPLWDGGPIPSVGTNPP
jgi:hypothetical protein